MSIHTHQRSKKSDPELYTWGACQSNQSRDFKLFMMRSFCLSTSVALKTPSSFNFWIVSSCLRYCPLRSTFLPGDIPTVVFGVGVDYVLSGDPFKALTIATAAPAIASARFVSFDLGVFEYFPLIMG